MPITFRDAIRRISPRWLQGGTAEKVMYSMAIQLDALTDSARAGIKLRFPGLYSPETLAMTGKDRRIRRGRYESDEVYAGRQLRWLDDHRRRGGPYALLEQIFAHYVPAPFAVALVYFSGRRFSMDTNGVISRDDITWQPDADTAKWARWWLFYQWPDPVSSDGLWSDPGDWDDGGVWDSDLTIEEVDDIRDLPREWNCAHAFGKVVLLSSGVELWDYPQGPWDEPGGIWGEDSGGVAQLDIG